MSNTITLQEFIAIARPDTTIIDVRESDEYTFAHIPGARHIQLSSLSSRIGLIPTDQRVYVICRSGVRSLVAVKRLLVRGIDAVSIEGGMRAWQEAGQPVRAGVLA